MIVAQKMPENETDALIYYVIKWPSKISTVYIVSKWIQEYLNIIGRFSIYFENTNIYNNFFLNFKSEFFLLINNLK